MNTLLDHYELIQTARLVASSHGADSADRFISQKTGCGLKSNINQFFNHGDVITAGIRRGMKTSQIRKLLAANQKPETTHNEDHNNPT